MSTGKRVGLLLVILLALGNVPSALAQSKSQLQGWQGPRPAPQQPPPAPTLQAPVPSGKQVLEIAPRPQSSTPELPPQSSVIAPSPQPAKTRPSQLVTVTVTDRDGRYVPGLRPEDFIIYEEDMPQAITYFNTGQDEPVSLGFIIDTSGSMLNKIVSARRALRRFLDAVRPQDEVFLEAFNQRPMLLQDFTDSRALLLQATTQLQPDGGTALYDAVLDGLRRVQQGRRQKKALIVLTDGLDGNSVASRNQTIEAIQHSGVLVYTIGIGNPAGGSRVVGMAPTMSPLGSPLMGRGPMGPYPTSQMARVDESVDSPTLQALSEETGGKYFLLNTADVVGSGMVLDQAAQAISDELRQQYSLGYKSALKGDVYRTIRVEVRRDGLTVRTHKGMG
jgi:Ca-activated chloride channel homolog